MGFTKRNIDKEQRTGENTKVITKYITYGRGSTGSTVNPVNGYNVYLDSNTGVFRADNNLVSVNQGYTLKVNGYSGTSALDTSVGAIAGTIVNKLTSTVRNNGGTNVQIDVSAFAGLDTSAGELSFPVYINTLNPRDASGNKDASYWDASEYNLTRFDLKWSWQLVNNGEDGEDGHDGADGSKGDKGDTGLTGPTCRGPFKWVDESVENDRWFYDGKLSGSAPSDSSRFIDIVITENGNLWYCNTSFKGTEDHTWNDVSTYFTRDSKFDFVATNLLLSTNAKIDFLTNNELHLIDSNNRVTAGAKGGNNINFWAGSTTPSTSSPFYVKNDGTVSCTKLEAKNGCKIGGFDISGNTLNATDSSKYINISPSNGISSHYQTQPGAALLTYDTFIGDGSIQCTYKAESSTINRQGTTTITGTSLDCSYAGSEFKVSTNGVQYRKTDSTFVNVVPIKYSATISSSGSVLKVYNRDGDTITVSKTATGTYSIKSTYAWNPYIQMQVTVNDSNGGTGYAYITTTSTTRDTILVKTSADRQFSITVFDY